MFPLVESKDDCELFPVVDVIVPFSEREHLGEVGTGVKVAIDIFLHKNCSSSKERGISHE